MRDARMILREFVGLEATETVVIVLDRDHRLEAEALTKAALEIGAKPIELDISSVIDAFRQSTAFWQRPPDNLIAAVQRSNVSIFVVDETYAFRLDHQISGLFITGPECSIYKLDPGMGNWNLSRSEVDSITRLGYSMMKSIDGGSEVHIMSDHGTDVTLSIAGRGCLPVFPIPDRGKPYGLAIPLWGEYNWAPQEDQTNGTIVIDGLSEADRQMRVVQEPVVLTVRGGRVTKVEGGVDADKFRDVLAYDEGASVVAELGVGGNTKALLGTESEKARLGTVHFGFGNNRGYPGGENESEVHVDGVVRDATLVVDTMRILERGELVIGADSSQE